MEKQKSDFLAKVQPASKHNCAKVVVQATLICVEVFLNRLNDSVHFQFYLLELLQQMTSDPKFEIFCKVKHCTAT